MDPQDFDDACSLAQQIGAAVGQNIFNPTPLDRLIALSYPNHDVQLDYFQYGTSFLALGVSAIPVQQNIPIAADADFIWLQTAAWVNIANAGTTYYGENLPDINLLVTDTSSGRSLMNQPVPISSMAGSGRYPYNLPNPRLFAAKTLINLAATNLDTANTYNLWVTLIGVKVFDLGPSQS